MSGRDRKLTTLFIAMLATLALAATAVAQTPTTQVYGGDQGEVLGSFNGGSPDQIPAPTPEEAGDRGGAPGGSPTNVERGSAPATPVATAGSLPFTGFEAGMIALIGVALVGTGFAMRRMAKPTA